MYIWTFVAEIKHYYKNCIIKDSVCCHRPFNS